MLGVSLAFLAVMADAPARVSDVPVAVVVGGPVSGGRQVILSADGLWFAPKEVDVVEPATVALSSVSAGC